MTCVPKRLLRIQQWFGPVISYPLTDEESISLETPFGDCITAAAATIIAPSPTLKPHERVEIYNKQYWWRLLKIMEKDMPLVARIFGRAGFQKTLAIPYLTDCPPDTWSLSALANRFVGWLEKNYHEEDRKMILDAASIDHAFTRLFIAPNPPKKVETPLHSEEKMLHFPLALSPTTALFSLPYDLFALRKEMNKQEIEYWEENDFPELKKGNFYFVFYRTLDGNFAWNALPKKQYDLLELFKEGNTLNKVCESIEKLPLSKQHEIVENLSDWFQEAVAKSWIIPQ